MRPAIRDLRAALRQRRQPQEFRIRSSGWPPDALAALESLAQDGAARPASAADIDGHAARSVADMVTNLWRLRRRMTTSENGLSRMTQRHLDATWDALEPAGIKVQDHLGDPFDPGLAISVVAYQPSPAVVREQVIDAVRPTIYLNGKIIQEGEVIVGTPKDRPTPEGKSS